MSPRLMFAEHVRHKQIINPRNRPGPGGESGFVGKLHRNRFMAKASRKHETTEMGEGTTGKPLEEKSSGKRFCNRKGKTT